MTFDGGTLEITSAAFSSSRAFVLDSGGGTLDYEFSGTAVIAGISGVGALTKSGTATAILENAAYTGGTTIASGVLEVGTTASGALTGTGGVTATLSGPVVNEGTLDIVNADTTGLTSLTDESSGGAPDDGLPTLNFYNSSSTGTATLNLSGTGVASFFDDSSAGHSTINLTLYANESLSFNDNSTAGYSQITMEEGNVSDPTDDLVFHDSSNAGHATIFDYASDSGPIDGNLETITFADNSSAADATIYDLEYDSKIQFIDDSTAANSTIVTYYYNNQDLSGVDFNDHSSAGNATLEALDQGVIDFNGSGPNGDDTNTAGSIALDPYGVLELNATRLTVGSNNLSTTVSGSITGSGSLVKVGTGTLTLGYSGQYAGIYSEYSGGTTIEDGTIDLRTTQGAGSGAFTFAGSAGSVAKLALETAAQPSNNATFANPLEDFGADAELDLKGFTGLTTLYTPPSSSGGNGTLAVMGLSGTTAKTENFALADPGATTFTTMSDGDGGTLIEAVCFAGGTRIRILRDGTAKDIVVEALRVGDLAVTASGALRPIKWLGHRSVDCRRHPRPLAVMPVRIAAHAFADNRPARDLYVSPAHALCVDDRAGEVLIPAVALVNGTSVQQVDVATVTYWHVELDSHDILLADNLAAESYIDCGNRNFFAEAGVVALDAGPDVPAATTADYCRPFHDRGALVETVRAALRARAEAAGWRLAAGDALGDVHLVVDGVRIEAARRGLSVCFALPAGARDVRLVSSAACPRDVGRGADPRPLGLAVAAISLHDGFDVLEVALDDPRLRDGSYRLERAGGTTWRWTDGRARLPAELWADRSSSMLLRIDLRARALPRWLAPAAARTPSVGRA